MNDVPSIVPKIDRSQALQAELDAFLANGGQIKQLDNSGKAVEVIANSERLNRITRFLDEPKNKQGSRYNLRLREFLAEDERYLSLLSKFTGISEDDIQCYAKGFITLNVRSYMLNFSNAVMAIREQFGVTNEQAQ